MAGHRRTGSTQRAAYLARAPAASDEPLDHRQLALAITRPAPTTPAPGHAIALRLVGSIQPIIVGGIAAQLTTDRAGRATQGPRYLAQAPACPHFCGDAVSFFVGELVVHVQPLSGRMRMRQYHRSPTRGFGCCSYLLNQRFPLLRTTARPLMAHDDFQSPHWWLMPVAWREPDRECQLLAVCCNEGLGATKSWLPELHLIEHCPA